MKNEIYGNVHSIETLGTVDGPGIRFVIFMQGCPMRCKYCHNPDTWEYSENKKMSVNEILCRYDSVKEFLKNGGITVTGGEPLVQIKFLTELFKTAKQKKIHTAIDTSGILFNKEKIKAMDNLLKYTDLVLLDIKHIDESEHKKLTKYSNKPVLDFAKYLSEKNIPVWIRHVVIPSVTNDEKYLKELGEFLASLENIKALDVIPYHNMAIKKYENLGIEYPLKNTPLLSKDMAIKAREIIFQAYQNKKNNI